MQSGAAVGPPPAPGRAGRRTVLRYLLGPVLVAVLIVAGCAFRVLTAAGPEVARPADVLLVLGAAQYNGRPSAVYAARLDRAAQLYRAGAAPEVMTLGGGQPGDETTEGAAGRAYLLTRGVPARAVTAIGVGGDTLVSLRAATRVARSRGWRSAVLVTDRWHSARAGLMAADLGWRVQLAPVRTGPSVRPDLRTRYVARETAGLLFYLLTGGSSGAGPTVT